MTTDSDVIVLPNEVWVEIFHDIEFDDLLSASLTCRSLHSASSPRRFKRLSFVPYYVNRRLDRFSLPDANAADQLAKMRFFTSAAIAPLVRTCSVNPLDKLVPIDYDKLEQTQILSSSGNHDLFEAFFELLPRLTSLQNLHFLGIAFTPSLISQLSKALRNIRFLFLNACTLAPITAPFPTIYAEEVVYLCESYKYDIRSSETGAEGWMHLLASSSLTKLDITQTLKTTAELIFQNLAALPPFPNLVSLSLDWNPHTIRQIFLSVLPCFPSLRRLAFSALGRQVKGEIAAAAAEVPHSLKLPLIQHYKGPHQLLSRFRVDTLVSLELDTGNRGGDPDELLFSLEACKEGLRGVEHFEAQVLHFSELLLLRIGLLLPGVKTLHLSSIDANTALLSVRLF
ncbi:hypothetical protein H0H87_005383 [Tephrocybe sp. NHM501043]|nr:hypothetical protein H0H87_005383 [Tephrocybe sp. NHM501043]